ncbi:MAG: hypothetical protein KatS3mg042_1064 [Rhodothermaceae bacterium]|nr:MAG: hypothetical protein KatS3mg042_1064 [Rhodothermaceae bacterium]
MNRMRLLYLTVGLAGLFGGGCLGDAPHSNPLDPLSDDFEAVGQADFIVTSFYAPFRPLDSVEVVLTPGPFLGRTDGQGRLILSRLPEGLYEMEARRAGYAAVRDTLRIRTGRTTLDTLRLDGLPDATAVQFATVHIRRRWPPPFDLYQLEVQADVADPDGLADVEQVWLELPGEGFTAALPPTAEPGRFANVFAESTLPTASLHALLGLPFQLRLRDRAGVEHTNGPHQLVRVIEPTPLAVAPVGGITLTDPRPTLQWQAANLPYPFTYRIEVFRDESVSIRERVFDHLPPDSLSVRLDTPLAPGAYFWTVSVVDTFGNRSRSNREGFIIQ